MSSKEQCLYRIFFTSHEKSYEIYARRVGQADIYGFIEIEGLLFSERSSVVVDPAEEALRKEFGGVRKLMVPFQAVHRIDEVEKEGRARILSLSVSSGKNQDGSGAGTTSDGGRDDS